MRHNNSFSSREGELFQLTHSRGVRPVFFQATGYSLKFQLTHSRGVRRNNWMHKESLLNFNSRTHVECDILLSQHTSNDSNFNSRTHVECDIPSSRKSVSSLHFNSRTHVECDRSFHSLFTDNTKFQLTHSRGVRPIMEMYSKNHSDFNSRTHVECDSDQKTGEMCMVDFNSRTHVECDSDFQCRYRHTTISTHALTWSATFGYNPKCFRIGFQLTHSRGVRHL